MHNFSNLGLAVGFNYIYLGHVMAGITYTEIKKLIKNLIYNKLITIIKKIKKTNRYTNIIILAFK